MLSSILSIAGSAAAGGMVTYLAIKSGLIGNADGIDVNRDKAAERIASALMNGSEYLETGIRSAFVEAAGRLHHQGRYGEAFEVHHGSFRAQVSGLGLALPNDGGKNHLFTCNYMLADALISVHGQDLIYLSVDTGCAMATQGFRVLSQERKLQAVHAMFALAEHLGNAADEWNDTVHDDVAHIDADAVELA